MIVLLIYLLLTIFSNTLIDDNTAVKHSSGVFSTPNQTVPADTLSARYVWKHVLRLAMDR